MANHTITRALELSSNGIRTKQYSFPSKITAKKTGFYRKKYYFQEK